MKRKHIIVVILLVFSGMFTMQGCKKDESPTPVVYKAFTVPTGTTSPAPSAAGTVKFTGTTVDLIWASEGSGAANNWTVYFGTGKAPALFQSGVTAQKLTVPVVDGQTYYWKVETVDAKGVKTSSAVNKFTAVDGSNPKMKMSLTTTTDILSSIGLDLEADDVVDLRLLIQKKSDLSIVDVIDVGYANEDFAGFADLEDGEYVFGVDILSTINAGDVNAPVSLSLALKFSQLGIIDSTLYFPDVMNNVNSCDLYRTQLATVTKVGSSYSVVSSVSNWASPDADPNSPVFAGTWGGFDADLGYPSEVVSEIVAGKLKFTGIGRGWMQDAWGEVITKEYPITMNFNFCAGTLIIPKQKIMETTWKGDAQPAYSIQGTGVFDLSGAYPSMLIHYDFVQGTATIAQYLGVPYFTLEISLDPGKKRPINTGAKGSSFPIHPKR